MTIGLTTDQIVEKFCPGHALATFAFNACTLDFRTEPEQEAGIEQYEKDGWTVVKADFEPKRKQFFFQAIKPHAAND